MTTGAPRLDVLVAEARAGSRRALGRLFSEAERAALDGPRAAALLAALAAPPVPLGPAAGRVVGFTGAPGSGKSSLAAVVSRGLLDRGRRVAVLAVDPSSPVSGGAVLGDRVRFSDAAGDSGLASDSAAAAGAATASDTAAVAGAAGAADVTAAEAGGAPARFVRSIASRGHAGGLAQAVPLAVAVAAGVGFDDVLVETVGSGQGEVAVVAAVDTTVLVAAPGQGDEVQAMKAGIAELADIICVTKADLAGAAEAARQWRAALAPARAGDWERRVVSASARSADAAALLAALDARADWLAGADGRRGSTSSAPHRPDPPGGRGPTAGAESGGAKGGSDAVWRAAAAAAATGATAATVALLGAALLASARDRVGAGVADEDLMAVAGLDRVLTATDLAAGRLATTDGLVVLVATVRGRLGRAGPPAGRPAG